MNGTISETFRSSDSMRVKLALRAKKRREIKNKEKKRKLELPLGSFGPASTFPNYYIPKGTVALKCHPIVRTISIPTPCCSFPKGIVLHSTARNKQPISIATLVF